MEVIQISGNELICDREATLDAYRSYTPHVCDCSSCRNYRAARDGFFHGPGAEFLGQFGIDVNKEAEIYEVGPDPVNSNLIQYGGWFHFIGHVQNDGDRVRIGDNLIIWFSPKAALVPPSFAGQPLVQVEIEGTIPWVLAEPCGE